MDQITVLMAVYNPRENWLAKQLKSIDDQTYPNIELIICDDCSTEIAPEKLQRIVDRFIQHIPCRVCRNQTNLGSTKTFERLTAENTGEYFAYCDQDDIWDCNKVYKEWAALSSGGGCMICTNADAIDEAEDVIATGYMSIPHALKKRIAEGEAWKALLIKNYFWGCTMLIRAVEAKRSLPFLKEMYHDHYMELYAAMNGKIIYLDEPLMRYRIHENNQTGFLKGISSKEEYCNKRIVPLKERYQELLKREIAEECETMIKKLLAWVECRERYAGGEWTCCTGVIKGIRYNIATALFELLTMQMPEAMWNSMLAKMKKIKNPRYMDKQE